MENFSDNLIKTIKSCFGCKCLCEFSDNHYDYIGLSTSDDFTLEQQKNDELRQRLDSLHDVINSDADLITIVKGIQEFVMLLNKHTTTRSAWEKSAEGKAARNHAEDVCSHSPDPYARAGVREKDFY